MPLLIYRQLDYSILGQGPVAIHVPFIDSTKDPKYNVYHTLCSGCQIFCRDVYSVCAGVVVFLDVWTNQSVVVQYDNNTCMVYGHLKEMSVTLGSTVAKGDRIGTADTFVQFEAWLSSGPSTTWSTSVGANQYYKQDPESFIDGTFDLPDIDASAYASMLFPVTLDYTLLKPYVARLTHEVTDVNWAALQACRVSGVILEAGWLFSNTHVKQQQFMSPNLLTLMPLVEEHKLPHGFYFLGRAHNVVEAHQEIYELSYIIRRWPVSLGVWICPQLTNDIEVNTAIFDVYTEQLESLGLHGAIGILANRAMLSLVPWTTLQETWLLWLIDKIEDTSEIDRLLDPDFFRLEAAGS